MEFAKRILIAVVLLGTCCFAQEPSRKTVARLKAENAALRVQVEQLKQENALANDLLTTALTSYQREKFSPVTVGDKTFNTEQEFIAEFNRTADSLSTALTANRLLANALYQKPQLQQQQSSPLLPTFYPTATPSVPLSPEVRCTTQYSPILKSSYTTCN